MSTTVSPASTKSRLLLSPKLRYVLLAALAILGCLRLTTMLLRGDVGEATLAWESSSADTLVVLVHGLTGAPRFSVIEQIARRAYPASDGLTFHYSRSAFRPTEPARLAHSLEVAIHEQFERKKYQRVRLIGHSLGAVLLRKAIVWGNGHEEDRTRFGASGRREWTEKTDFFVSLAGTNRGWSVDPKPKDMNPLVRWAVKATVPLARLTGLGRLYLDIQRGAPFVADLRIQWILAAREQRRDGVQAIPKVIHLLGNRDDIVSAEDSFDLAVARNTEHVLIDNTGHGEMVDVSLTGGGDSVARKRTEIVWQAIRAPESITGHRMIVAEEDPSVRRLMYITHGIRDYGNWTDVLRSEVARLVPRPSSGVAVIPPKYGYFPMMPFLLFWDRQEHVRQFMDDHTENLAKFPNVGPCAADFVGHSNGTYILGSALQRYETLCVERALLAGSVLPWRYPWIRLVEKGRVRSVRNIVADGDWVVALFPAFIEQIADWIGYDESVGMLDIGKAGFRGFKDSKDPLERVRDIKFVKGGHGAAFDGSARMNAVVQYAASGDDTSLRVFDEVDNPKSWLDLWSNVAWTAWLLLVLLLVVGGRYTYRKGRVWFAGFVVICLGILFTF